MVFLRAPISIGDHHDHDLTQTILLWLIEMRWMNKPRRSQWKILHAQIRTRIGTGHCVGEIYVGVDRLRLLICSIYHNI